MPHFEESPSIYPDTQKYFLPNLDSETYHTLCYNNTVLPDNMRETQVTSDTKEVMSGNEKQ